MQKVFLRTSAVFALLSVVCAFAAVALSCFDQFPMHSGYYPPRPTYFIMIAGMVFWFISGRWYFGLAQHRVLFLLVFLLLAFGGVSTYLGARAHGADRLFVYFTHSYIKWRVIPFLGLCWFASLFSSLRLQLARQIFAAALLILFIPNVVHMFLEFLANRGFDSVKNLLVSINSYFRTEAIVHGWWPPPFYEGRIRGLFVEPSSMTNGLMPLFGLFSYFAVKNKYALIPMCFLLALYVSAKSFAGYLVVAVFFGLLGGYAVRNYVSRYKLRSVCFVLIICIASVYAFQKIKITPQYMESVSYFSNIGAISKFLHESHDGKTAVMPEVDYSSRTRYSILSRLLVMRLDFDTALRRPMGIGFGRRGFYWAPLDPYYNSLGNEEKVWIRDAANDPARGIPPLSEYTVTLAEAGFPGLVLVVVLFGYIGLRAFRHFLRTKDAYAGFMLCAYAAMTIELITIALFGINLYLLFAGYMYAVSRSDSPGESPAGFSCAPQERTLGNTSS